MRVFVYNIYYVGIFMNSNLRFIIVRVDGLTNEIDLLIINRRSLLNLLYYIYNMRKNIIYVYAVITPSPTIDLIYELYR